MQTSKPRTGRSEDQEPARGQAGARRETSGNGAAVPPPLTAAALQAAQVTAGNAAVTGMIARRARTMEAPEQPGTEVHDVLRSAGKPLAGPVRQEMESRFDTDFSGVRLHTGPAAARSARSVGARAYTSGSHVVLGDGGADKHTLAHELTHVVQQRQGPVAGTDHGNGLRVSDPSDRFEREAEANAHRIMSGPAPVQRAEACTAEHCGPVSSGAAVIQRKGHEALSDKLPAVGSDGNPLKSFLKSWGSTPAQESPELAEIREAIKAYDADPKRDPLHCAQVLMTLLLAVGSAEENLTKESGSAARHFLTEARTALKAENNLVTEQIGRDGDFPAEAHAPFEAMTARGLLWNEETWADSAVAFAMNGPSYFRELSEMNRAGMANEISTRGRKDWVSGVERNLTAALRQSVLCHYTKDEARADLLSQANQIKSKTELLKDDPDAANNSEGYDAHVLANEGFVFFFLEAPGSEFRDTRFGKVRFEIPLADSPLESQGWLMLSDFAQREYPVIKADPEDPTAFKSELPTRMDKMPKKFSRPVREFDRGLTKPDLDMMELVMQAKAQETDPERASLLPVVKSEVAADEFSTMTYGAGHRKEKGYKERIRSNTLRGRDIIPGLVDRAVLEIMRMEDANPALANQLKSMSGAELMKFLLKDLLRPQAMLPNSVDLSNATMRVKS
ncbi:eCIS core domain-containing protein [Streptomyces sp. YIM S03343]